MRNVFFISFFVVQLLLANCALFKVSYAEDSDTNLAGLDKFIENIIRTAKENPDDHYYKHDPVVIEERNYGYEIDIEATRAEKHRVIREFKNRARDYRGRRRDDMENMISQLRDIYDRLIDQQIEINKMYRNIELYNRDKNQLIKRLNKRF